MTLSAVKVGAVVFVGAKRFKVLSVDPKQTYPVLVQNIFNGTTGRFRADRLTHEKAVS